MKFITSNYNYYIFRVLKICLDLKLEKKILYKVRAETQKLKIYRNRKSFQTQDNRKVGFNLRQIFGFTGKKVTSPWEKLLI